METSVRERSYTPPVAPTVALLFLWGMANNLNDILIAHFYEGFRPFGFLHQFRTAGVLSRLFPVRDGRFAAAILDRFFGTAAMTRGAPHTMLAVIAGMPLILTLVAGVAGGWFGVCALVAASFFMSIQLPRIFALGVQGFERMHKSGASLLIMSSAVRC